LRQWRSRRDDRERRRRASFSEHLQQIKRGRVGPVEVFEREHERLRAGAREHPSDHCGELAASQLVGCKFRRADSCKKNIEQRREQRRKLHRIELNLGERGFEVGKPRFRRDLGAAKSLLSPFDQRMERGILQQLR
jgi:hypothetical protein